METFRGQKVQKSASEEAAEVQNNLTRIEVPTTTTEDVNSDKSSSPVNDDCDLENNYLENLRSPKNIIKNNPKKFTKATGAFFLGHPASGNLTNKAFMEEMEKLSDTLLRVSGQGDTRNLLQPHLDVHQDLLQDRTRGEETDVCWRLRGNSQEVTKL